MTASTDTSSEAPPQEDVSSLAEMPRSPRPFQQWTDPFNTPTTGDRNLMGIGGIVEKAPWSSHA